MFEIRYEDHTDNVQEKLRLIREAYGSGNYDLALSLAESIKDTITFERQMRGDTGRPQLGAETFAAVGNLPPAWAKWARGWAYSKPVTFFETGGIARRHEPVDLSAGFRVDQTTDLQREVRGARVAAGVGRLR